MLAADRREKLQNELGGFGLPSATLARDDDGLVVLVATHEVVRIIRNGEDVWGQLAKLAILVLFHCLAVVDIENLVWIDCDKNRARIRLLDEIPARSNVRR